MSEMVERVAKAIFDAGWRDLGGIIKPCWSDIPPTSPVYEQAHAAIAAMREPTKEMEVVAQEEWMSVYVAEYRGKVIWQAMIDEALSDRSLAMTGEAK